MFRVIVAATVCGTGKRPCFYHLVKNVYNGAAGYLAERDLPQVLMLQNQFTAPLFAVHWWRIGLCAVTGLPGLGSFNKFSVSLYCGSGRSYQDGGN